MALLRAWALALAAALPGGGCVVAGTRAVLRARARYAAVSRAGRIRSAPTCYPPRGLTPSPQRSLPHHRARSSPRAAVAAAGTPMVPFKMPNSEYFQWVGVYDRMARDRIMFVSRPLNDEVTNSLIATLLFLENEDRKAPVNLYMNVPGALTKSGLAVYDTMRTMSYPIGTVNLGLCAHMGAFLCAAGTRGRRSTLPNSRYVLCAPAMVMAAGAEAPVMQAEDLGREVREVLRDRERLVQGYAELCGQTAEAVRKVLQRNTYFDAEEAKEFGLVDNVLASKMGKKSSSGDTVSARLLPHSACRSGCLLLPRLLRLCGRPSCPQPLRPWCLTIEHMAAASAKLNLRLPNPCVFRPTARLLRHGCIGTAPLCGACTLPLPASRARCTRCCCADDLRRLQQQRGCSIVWCARRE